MLPLGLRRRRHATRTSKSPRRWAYRVLVALALVTLAGVPAHAQPAVPAPAVVVAPVELREVGLSARYIGRVEAIQNVDVRARVEGFVEQVAFQEGDDVHAGQLLFRIEKAPYEAALASAKAQVAKAHAALKEAEANFERQAQLNQRGFQTRAVLEQATAQRDTAAAELQNAQAAVATAQLNLDYTTIESPIDGRIGKAAFTKGNLVDTGAGALATVIELDPIRVVFSVADRDVVSLRQRTGKDQEKLNQLFVPRLRLSNGSEYLQAGSIEFVDNRVDPTTGTLAVWARFANPKELLLPGQFVDVLVHATDPDRRPVVPVTAVQQDKNGKFVLVVGSDDVVTERRIAATRQSGQDWIVQSGLEPGELVIVEGVQKARPGAKVQPTRATPDQAASGGAAR